MSDVLIIGSGPGGVNVAYPLCEAGLDVTMLDYGNDDHTYAPLIPHESFETIRRGDPNQHRYFLGDEFEGVLMGDIRVGTKLTPPRLHTMADAPELLPVSTDGFAANQSLALGGLAASWGSGALPFRPEETRDMALSRDELEPNYQRVTERVGICGTAADDLGRLYGDCGGLLPPIDLDSGAEKVLARYQARREQLRERGFLLGRSRLAVCTREHRGRGPHQYRDMEYWADTDQSVYRPRYTLEELKGFDNFTYLDRRLALGFEEQKGGTVQVKTKHADTGQPETHSARALVLAAGTLGSARLALGSSGAYGRRVPLLSNPYTYVPTLNLAMLGQKPRDARCSLGQVGMHFANPQAGRPAIHCYLFSYRSLLTFKLLKEAPLPHRELLRIMRALMPVFGVLTIFHQDLPTPDKYAVLRQTKGEGPDLMEISYRYSEQEQGDRRASEKEFMRLCRKLGLLGLKALRRAPGASIHYSGTLPMAREGGELTCDTSGRLRPYQRVYVADGSLISPLPATMLTLTIMALADRVGQNLAKELSP